jgi:hypothetical protein
MQVQFAWGEGARVWHALSSGACIESHHLLPLVFTAPVPLHVTVMSVLLISSVFVVTAVCNVVPQVDEVEEESGASYSIKVIRIIRVANFHVSLALDTSSIRTPKGQNRLQNGKLQAW